MNPELTIFAENKVCDVIDGIKTMDDCGRASKVIDAFESMSNDKETIQGFREYLCTKTFDIYDQIYGKYGGIKRNVQTEFNGNEMVINII